MLNYHNGYGPIDRFCSKHPRFGVPNLMRILVIIQAVVYVADLLGGFAGVDWLSYLYFVPYYIVHGQVWRLVTWLVVPYASNPFYMILGCYLYLWTSNMLERQWGSAKFSLFYLSGALISVVLGMIMGLIQPSPIPMALSYYLNLSIFLVIATIFSENKVLLYFVLPIKMKWLALVDVVLIAVEVVQLLRYGIWSIALVPIATFINYFIFTWPFWRAKLGRVKYQTDPKVVNFRKARKQAQKQEQQTTQQGWRHKCAVCGVTDAMEPDMEFRYCSKCDGYYCYCSQHINNHVHVKHDQN